eukprot:COSAG01_NODE_6645_length_3566_cov_2.581194_7_plen_22_part_01
MLCQYPLDMTKRRGISVTAWIL